MAKQPKATPQNLYQITGNVADINTVLIARSELRRLQAENDGVQALVAVHQRTLERCLELKAECAELEAMLDAVGAGGVGQSIQPLVQADTAAHQEPVAWRAHPFDYGVGYKGAFALTMRPDQVEMWKRKGWRVDPLYTAPQPTENLNRKSNQKRLATLWGYVKQGLAHQPLTDEQIIEIADKTKTAEPGTDGYILPISFARAIESAHNITGDQQ